ncbi:hypothetical protein HBN54_004103 [Hymenobacter sp. 1B]|uniref:Glycosyltransferase n=1 Tax=Hymenobacter artigasi TaxID=2719616 RepID=A0ABX1HNK4_9BACT|nr:hypothetical protein [Hymenobacter artigasi]
MSGLRQMNVSMCCITYNHAAYLAQVFELVRSRNLEGLGEMVIVEKCSSDGTSALVLAYQTWHLAGCGCLPRCHPEYDGQSHSYTCDDYGYWPDSTKLQRQVDVL